MSANNDAVSLENKQCKDKKLTVISSAISGSLPKELGEKTDQEEIDIDLDFKTDEQ